MQDLDGLTGLDLVFAQHLLGEIHLQESCSSQQPSYPTKCLHHASPMYNVFVSSVAVEMLQAGHEDCNLPNEWYLRQHAFETAAFCGTHPVEQISFFFF